MSLHALEHRLLPLEHLLQRPSPPHRPLPRERTVAARLAAVERALALAVAGQPPLERFVHDYDANAPLLAPAFTLSSTPLPTSPPTDPSYPAAVAAPDDLSDGARVALLLSLAPTLQQAAGELDVVRALVEQTKVLDRPLAAPPPSATEPLAGLAAAARTAEGERARQEARVQALVGRYDAFVDGVSRTFLALHEDVAACERMVGALERKRAAARSGGGAGQVAPRERA